jgi:dienelactone hydrolase
MFVKRWWGRLRDWWLRVWTNIRPGPETRRGVFWAAVVTAFAAACAGALTLQSGFGLWVDFLFAFLVAGLGISLVAVLTAFLIVILRNLPKLLSGVVIGACIFVSLVLPPSGFVFVPLAIIVGAAVATVFSGSFRASHLSKKILTVVLGLAALAVCITLVVILAGDGTERDVVKLQPTKSPEPPRLDAANPSEHGPMAVKSLFYGSGTDRRRPEYGAEVSLKTATVDASPFFKDFKGWQEKLRRVYWGFGVNKLPLNARVWYPEGAGPFPLVLMVHGNHDMAEFSDPGYQYLGELLASRGFILASIDENFLNSGVADLPKEQAVRGWMLLEHLKLWRKWNAEPGNPFSGKVDFENIALMGHSRGGEAAATAALFNTLSFDPDDATITFAYRFPIKAIVAIAPADGQYKPAGERRTIENVSYLTLQGANDADVSSFMGSSQFDRVKFTDPHGPWFKAEIYAYRANHGQFNTVWGRSDAGEPLGWYLNLKPLLSGDEQRRISKTYISAFLEATLHARHEYLPLFRDYRVGRAWLPSTLYINRFFDASYQPLANFSEDADVTSTTAKGGRISAENLSVWREGPIPTRSGDRGYNGVFLGWNRENNNKVPSYTITLPPDTPRGSLLTLSIAVTDETAPEPGKRPSDDSDSKKKKKDDSKKPKDEPTDFAVELETNKGARASLPLSRFGTLMPLFRVRFTKFAMLDNYAYKKPAEPVFQTFELPLKAFGIDDPRQLRVIRLRFDKTVTRVVILSQIGFEQ